MQGVRSDIQRTTQPLRAKEIRALRREQAGRR